MGDPAAIARSLEAPASLAAAQEGLCVSAARILGAVESLREGHGCGRPALLADEHTAVVEIVRKGLGPEVFEAEWREGRALSTRAAVAYAARHAGRGLPRPTSGWEALTGSELGVAELVVEGRTNADIADELGITPATVKAHLRRVYAKVGVANRTALAAASHRRGADEAAEQAREKP